MTDIEIQKQFTPLPIMEIATKLGVEEKYVEPYGKLKAKINVPISKNPKGKLILVTAINPTPYGEGKTTVSVGLADAFNLAGEKICLTLREPSLGPIFGIKGGATGGGYSQVTPMEEINLHFTGDFHAISTANNLLSALIDNHIKQGNELGYDKVVWRRTMDMNDRALRNIEIALGGSANGIPRVDGFDITAASEVMAILCLADGVEDLKRRLGNIITGYDKNGRAILAKEIKAEEAMTILLYNSLSPNLVQTLIGTPALIHGGPFANIAHGCNSIGATKTALTLADYVITEAGFGSELGAEKFMDIKCRQSGLKPSTIVLVATARALKYNGGADKNSVNIPNIEALKKGLCNLQAHIENLQKFNVPVVVAVNRFTTDTDEELDIIINCAQKLGVKAVISNPWEQGGNGCEELYKTVKAFADNYDDEPIFAYSLSHTIKQKIQSIAVNLYGAGKITYSKQAEAAISALEGTKYEKFPICIAKTQYSLSQNKELLGRPTGFDFTVQDVLVRGGAEFLVVICGDIMLMPGLPKHPNSESMSIDINGNITGLF